MVPRRKVQVRIDSSGPAGRDGPVIARTEEKAILFIPEFQTELSLSVQASNYEAFEKDRDGLYGEYKSVIRRESVDRVCSENCAHSTTYSIQRPVIEFWNSACPKIDKVTRMYKLLPGFLDNRSNWPTSTNVHCHWCTYPFEGLPVPLPVYLTNNGRFKTTGCFCSFNCAQGFALKEGKMQSVPLLQYLQRVMTGKSEPITPAPSRYTLQIYGGPLSIEDFRRSACSQTLATVKVLEFPLMINVNNHVETSMKFSRQGQVNLSFEEGEGVSRETSELQARMSETKERWRANNPVPDKQGPQMSSAARKKRIVKNPTETNATLGVDVTAIHERIGLKIIRK